MLTPNIEARLRAGEVRLRIEAASLNFPDLLIVQGKYQMKPPLPFVPGSDCGGEIAAVGSGVTRFKPGDRIVALDDYADFARTYPGIARATGQITARFADTTLLTQAQNGTSAEFAFAFTIDANRSLTAEAAVRRNGDGAR